MAGWIREVALMNCPRCGSNDADVSVFGIDGTEDFDVSRKVCRRCGRIWGDLNDDGDSE